MSPEKTKGAFKTRKFVVVLAALSGLTLPVTGLVIHLRHFSPLTRGRHVWMTAHTVFAICFIVCCVWHAALNWRSLRAALLDASEAKALPTRECLLALAILGLLGWFVALSRGR